jgi:hypothetical protein
VDVEEAICGVADVGGRQLTDGRGVVCSGRGRFTDLLVVGVAVGQGGGEDGPGLVVTPTTCFRR